VKYHVEKLVDSPLINPSKCTKHTLTHKELKVICNTFFPDYQASPHITIDVREASYVRKIMKLSNFFILP